MEALKNEIAEILTKKLKNKFAFDVTMHKGLGGTPFMKIWIACSNIDINGVSGQKPQVVSLMLEPDTMDLHPQIFGGNGGQSIFRQPNLNDPAEKYLAMKSVKIPFRRPQPTAEKVKACIEKFVDNYITALKENKDVLMYKNLVNYDEVLSE